MGEISAPPRRHRRVRERRHLVSKLRLNLFRRARLSAVPTARTQLLNMVFVRIDARNVCVIETVPALCARFVLQIRQRIAFRVWALFLQRLPIVRFMIAPTATRFALLPKLRFPVRDEGVRRLPSSAALRAPIISVRTALLRAIA